LEQGDTRGIAGLTEGSRAGRRGCRHDDDGDERQPKEDRHAGGGDADAARKEEAEERKEPTQDLSLPLQSWITGDTEVHRGHWLNPTLKGFYQCPQ